MSRRPSLRSERGIALPVVLGCLMVLSILAAGLLTTATRSSSGSNESRASKRALAAAEAGLQTAAYRLKTLDPADDMCMTTPLQQANTTGAAALASGECPASPPVAGPPEPVAARAGFRYWVTPVGGNPGASCGSLPGSPPSASSRCITSMGIVNPGRPDEVVRRIQARVELLPNLPFAIAGVVGTNSVTLTNDVWIEKTDVGSNGQIRLVGTPGSVDIAAKRGSGGPGGGGPTTGSSTARPYRPTGGDVVPSGTYKVDAIENASSKYGLVHPDFASTLLPGGNNNADLKARYPTYFDETTRILTIPADKEVKLRAGTYNLCGWTMGKGSSLNMDPDTAAAKIYLDSPRRTGSGCTSGGKFTAIGQDKEIKVNNGKYDANVLVYVYGTTAGATAEDIVMQGKAHIDAVWFAPDSIFRASDDVLIHGGVVARHIVMRNKVHAVLDVALESVEAPGTGQLSRQAWFECRPKPTTATDPESGC